MRADGQQVFLRKQVLQNLCWHWHDLTASCTDSTACRMRMYVLRFRQFYVPMIGVIAAGCKLTVPNWHVGFCCMVSRLMCMCVCVLSDAQQG